MKAIFLIFLHRDKGCVKSLNEMRLSEAFIIGVFQCIAIIPGVSRSGSTISIASRFGFQHETAAKFSFFLGIIAIFGANVLTAFDIIESVSKGEPLHLSWSIAVIGFILAFAVGYYSLKILIHVLTQNKLSLFGYYCFGLAAIICIFTIKL